MMGFLAIVRHSIYLAFNPVVMQLTCCMQKKTAGQVWPRGPFHAEHNDAIHTVQNWIAFAEELAK